MRGEKATAIQFTICFSLCLTVPAERRTGYIYICIYIYQKLGVVLLHTHAFFSAHMKARGCTKWREDALEPQYGAWLEDTRNDESKTLNKGF